MSKVHMSLKGEWVLCHAKTRECPRQYHLPNMTPAEAKKLPRPFLEQLFGPISGPPDVVSLNGDRYWEERGNSANDSSEFVAEPFGPIMLPGGKMIYLNPHRDYDLPAVESADGAREWWMHGIRHRDHDRPAVIKGNGTQEWWTAGKMHRDGKPAVITAEGDEHFFVEGHMLDPVTKVPLFGVVL